MSPQLFIKLSALFVLLVIVYGAMKFTNSNEFTANLDEMFGTGVKPYKWCPEHTVHFQWLDENISEKWKKASPGEIQKRFCQLTLEPIQNVDLAKITFKPLLKAQSAEAKTALLEWAPESQVFQVNGLPFYSASLAREIVDK